MVARIARQRKQVHYVPPRRFQLPLRRINFFGSRSRLLLARFHLLPKRPRLTRRRLQKRVLLRPLLGNPAVVIVDCRFDLASSGAGRQAYLTAHIPGACFADLNQDLSVPPTSGTGRHPLPGKEQFTLLLGALGIDNGTQVIAYDQGNGALAARRAWRWASS